MRGSAAGQGAVTIGKRRGCRTTRQLRRAMTLFEDGRDLVAGKRDAARSVLPLPLPLYLGRGRFRRGRSEFADEAVAFTGRQGK